MPILYHMDDIESDMNLGSDIYGDYEVILPEGWQLSSVDVSYLKNEFPEQYASIAISVLDSVTPFEDQRLDRNISLEARKHAFDAYKKLTERVIHGHGISPELILDIRSSLAKILTLVQFNPVKTALLSHLYYEHDYQTHLTANSLFLSLLIGNKIKDYIKETRSSTSSVQKIKNPESLTPLTIGAFYRDVGMISKDPLWLKEALTETDKRQIINHTAESSRMLADLVSPQVRQAISHHHENFNGTGFPEHIAGDKINIYARIIRVADAYCTGISIKNDGQATHPSVVLHDMLNGNQKEQFDPEVTKALAMVVQPFEIGSKLTLHDGRTAVVTGHTPGEPFRPNIVILNDTAGNLLFENHFQDPIHMAERTDLKIMTVNGQNVSFLYSQDF